MCKVENKGKDNSVNSGNCHFATSLRKTQKDSRSEDEKQNRGV